MAMHAEAPLAEHPWLRAYPAGVDWAMPMPTGETLVSVFDAAVSRFAARPAMDFLGRRWTYAQLGDAVARAAEGLRRMGVEPGTRVGLCLPNTPFHIIAYFAALKAGATVVNFSPLYVEEELAAQAIDSGTEVMVTIDLDPMLPRVLSLLNRADVPVRRVVACRFPDALPFPKGLLFRVLKGGSLAAVPRGDDRVVGFGSLLAAPPIAAPPAVAADAIAVLQYTGGTTGVPKGVMLTHANLCANLRQMQAWFTTCRQGEERILAVIPFFHVFAMTVAMNSGVAMGAEIIMLPRFDWPMLLAALRRTRPTMFPGVPTLFKACLDNGATREDLASVRACLSGGAPLPLAVKQAFEALSGSTMVEGYGLTEASPVCFSNPFEAENRAGTIGLPMPGLRAEIRSLEDPTRALPPGERGELHVAGPNVMAGYWNRPADTADVLGPDGFLRTGDVGIMDADGYVTLVDRIKDLILVSGFNVYPRVIEEALYRHPDVAAVTVVGMPDAYRGEAPAAFVQPVPGATLTAEALREFLKDKLNPVEMPRLIEIRDSLPRTLVGKLSKKELKQELETRPAAEAPTGSAA
jgi:long-chain acyl-CoA synthetase